MMHIYIYIFILFFYISSCIDGIRWNYEIYNSYSLFPVTHDTVKLTYISEDDGKTLSNQIEWKSNCNINILSQYNINITCSTSGTKQIQVNRIDLNNQSDYIYIHIKERVACYNWYVTFVQADNLIKSLPSHTNDNSIELRIWVTGKQKSYDEIKHNSILPSNISQKITKQFQRLGETPNITLKAHNIDTFLQINNKILVYDDNNNYWKSNVQTNYAGALLAIVMGRGVSVLGCTIESLNDLWYISKYPASLTNITLTNDQSVNKNLSLTSNIDACAMNIQGGIILNTNMAYITQDGFITTKILEKISNNEILFDMAFTNQSILLLSNTSVYSINAGSDILQQLTNFTNVNRITSTTVCDQVLSKNINTLSIASNRYVFVWNSTLTRKIYVSKNYGENFESLLLPIKVDYEHINTIHEVIRLVNGQTIILLASLQTKDIIILYDEVNKEWNEGYIFEKTNRLLFNNNMKLSMLLSRTQTDALIIWGYRVYISMDHGTIAVPLQFRDFNAKTIVLLPVQEYIYMVSMNTDGSIAILTSSGRIFYGALGLSYVVEIVSSYLSNSVINHHHQLWSVYGNDWFDIEFNNNNNNNLPIYSSKRNIDFTLTSYLDVCNRHINESNYQEEVIYLDINESLNLYTNVVVHETDDIQPRFAVLSDHNIEIKSTYDEILNEVRNYENRILQLSITVAQLASRNLYTTGPSLAITSVEPVQLQCTISHSFDLTTNHYKPLQSVTRMYIGCPPQRNIRVRHSYSCENYASLDGGCPERVFHQSTDGWKPIVDLYDGDKFIKEMNGDYVIWEVNGRDDFYYNLDASDVKCHKKPSTWKDLIESYKQENNKDVLSLDDMNQVWTPEKTINCFEGSLTSFENVEYEILNSTSSNSISFRPKGKDGIFYFRLRVIDPHYSFCNLSTTFVLDVFGAPLSLMTTLLIVFSVTTVIILMLIVTYVRYNSEMSKLKLKDE